MIKTPCLHERMDLKDKHVGKARLPNKDIDTFWTLKIEDGEIK